MHSTKTEILALLKRSDSATVDDLASALNLAPMTVRQHLVALERDGLVTADEVRRATGRPHYRYQLTGNGHRQVADGHDRLLELLVDRVGHMEPASFRTADPVQRRATLFREAAMALAERYRPEVQALPPRDQIERVVDILRAHGGFPEWHDLGEEFEIRDFACPFRASVGDGVPCQWHPPFLSAILGVETRTADEPVDCAECCRHLAPIPASTSDKLRGERL